MKRTMNIKCGVNESAIAESSCAVQNETNAQEEEPPGRPKNLLEPIILDIRVNKPHAKSKPRRFTTSNADFPVSENSRQFISK